MSLRDAAAHLEMSTRQLLAAIDDGTIPAIKIGRTLRVPLWGLPPRPPHGGADTT